MPRPRILVLEGRGADTEQVERFPEEWDVVRAGSFSEGLALLRSGQFDGVFADTRDIAVRRWAGNLLQSEDVLASLPDGVAVLDADLKVLWANARFEKWGAGQTRGRRIEQALQLCEPLETEQGTLGEGRPLSVRVECRQGLCLDIHISPLPDPDGRGQRFLVVARDVTTEVQQQQKLEALHQAGQELAALPADQLADMAPEERIELLKANIRRLTHDLLHYDMIEVRLLDPHSRRLEPLVQVGMTPEAATRVLTAEAEGNGITGLVAATGKSYLCADTTLDRHYVAGAPGARSSMTVPLRSQGMVVGTFNVESPQPAAFSMADVQFAELFARQLAAALHTLELLSAEKISAATRSVDAISREVAIPVDEILTAATAVLDRYIGHDPEMAKRLRQILASARLVKESIQRIGEDLAPASPAAGPHAAHPRLRNMRILLADNDERVRRSAHAILGRLGCVVETARDGEEALTMARLSTYDAMLADIRLPDLSGFDVYQGLRKAQPQARVILMTSYGYDPSHAIVKARQEGLRFVLYKPFRVDQLLEALESPEPPAPKRQGDQSPRTITA